MMVRSSRHPECNHVSLLPRRWCKCHTLCLRNAVFASQMTVRFHCQRAAVLVSKPPGNGRNIHAAFNAARREQVPQVVMCDAICADLLARAIKRLLAFADTEYFCLQRFAFSFAPHPFKQRA